ncbi:MAG: hypothetical protein ACI86L_000726, partial [Dokdonia sp.]
QSNENTKHKYNQKFHRFILIRIQVTDFLPSFTVSNKNK